VKDIHTSKSNAKCDKQITGSKANEDVSKLFKSQNSKASGPLQLLHLPADGKEDHDSL
jgi:hypothetical protein